MSDREAVLGLVYKATNLAEGATSALAADLDKVGSKAGQVAGRITGAFRGMGSALSNAIGNSVENIAQGGDLTPTLLMAGAYMAGQLAENFGGQLIEKLAGSTIIGAIAGPLGALGSAAGGIIAAAIPIGMAALPVILVAALVAAVAILIVNEDIRNKAIGFVTGLVGTIAGALGTALGILPKVVGAAFGAAWDFVVKAVGTYIDLMVTLWLRLPMMLAGLGADLVRTIIGGLAGLPGQVARIVGDAFRSLKLDIGPFHITGGGVTVDLPQIDIPHFASGVRSFTGGLARVGELGPEIVRLPPGSSVDPTSDRPGAGGMALRLVGVTESQLVDVVERGLYVRLTRAAPTEAR